MHDYVIVGAGSAGCVLAARLSEDPRVSVLLIEAGPRDTCEDIHVPLGYLKLGAELDWGYESAPEERCANRRIALPRGKVLGGSSSTNAMIYIRGNRLDYDEWGVAGWSWSELLPYFKRAEDNERGACEWHGEGGPLAVSDQGTRNGAAVAFVAAAAQAGLAHNEDFNGAEQDGAGFFQVTQRGGSRASAADAYLRPAAERENLSVRTDVLARRIIFERTRAVGVEVQTHGEVAELRARREVILCAGAYNSPKLLMLSGIGPAEHLAEHGIQPLLDRPAVGANLSDHAATEVLWMASEPNERAARRRWRSTRLLLAAQAGAFGSNLAEAGAFARVGQGAGAPDVQLHVAPVQYLGEGVGEPEAHGVWISPCLLTPTSRGCVRLASGNPAEAPIVSNAFYAAREDLERLVQGLRLAIEIGEQPALERWCSEPFTFPDGTDERALREHVERTTVAFYHPVGTCRMGGDDEAAVDARLRVNGAEGLRVVDASVMPAVPRGNTNAPTIALAERAADLIGDRAAP